MAKFLINSVNNKLPQMVTLLGEANLSDSHVTSMGIGCGCRPGLLHKEALDKGNVLKPDNRFLCRSIL